jgi:hypothetical protein
VSSEEPSKMGLPEGVYASASGLSMPQTRITSNPFR